jgi:ATP-dependent Clp protease adaptor protein ClpS
VEATFERDESLLMVTRKLDPGASLARRDTFLRGPGPVPGAPWENPEEADELATAERRRTERPKRFQVVIHNDDFTTMDFVIGILTGVFGKSHAEATQIMLHVHHRGSGVAGVYPRDLAETKVAEATAAAQLAGMPLLLTIEPAPDADS